MITIIRRNNKETALGFKIPFSIKNNIKFKNVLIPVVIPEITTE